MSENPFILTPDLVRLFAEAGDKTPLSLEDQIAFLRRLTRLIVHSPNVASRLSLRFSDGYEKTMALKDESGFGALISEERREEMMEIYKEFFTRAAAFLLPVYEGGFAKTGLAFIKQQEAYAKGRRCEDGRLYNLHNSNPYIALNMSAAVIMDVLHHTKEETGDKFERTAAYHAFNDIDECWETIMRGFGVERHLYDETTPHYASQSILRQMDNLRDMIDTFDHVNALHETANTPQVDHTILNRLRKYMEPFKKLSLLPAPVDTANTAKIFAIPLA